MLQKNGVGRNIRKFKLKYGFDPHLYADGWALGLNNDELIQLLSIHPSVLDNFSRMQSLRKSCAKLPKN
ncbi:hypothetical protein CEB3_c16940 [Peptococcaceae bacterium CEB3]|nr:hypothetical protein CEB3_c16940 [Peptococcaceae bacterium CEB3]